MSRHRVLERLRRWLWRATALAALVLVGVAASRTRLQAPGPTLLVRDAGGSFVCELADPESRPDHELGYWPLAKLPPRLVAATLALEDRRFWGHPGVDLLAIVRAAVGNVQARRRISGASTVAMQVARMQDPAPRSYLNKAVEATTALLLTARFGRERVLHHYLRIAPYGNRIRGVGFAARRYLGKPVEDLSWAEIAFLAAIPQSPSRMNPHRVDGRDRAVRRGQLILKALHGRRLLDDAELELALQQIRFLRIPERETRPSSMLHAIHQIAASRPTGPLVETTIDVDLQQRVERIARARVAREEPAGVGNAAVVVVERGTWAVKAWVGSAGWGDRPRKGAIDYASIERSPGSTLKPFLYALALERGVLTPATVLDDLGRGPGGIVNSDERFLGPLLPRQALANSRTVPAAEVLRRVGLEEGFDLLREAGLHDGLEPASRYGLGLAIGGMPTTLGRLVRAYTALAGDGRVSELTFWRGQAQRSQRIFAPATADQLTAFLSDPLARLPTFPRMGATEYPFPVAIKTGTSSDYRDAWTVAWSSRYLVGAWLGDADQRPMDHRSGATSAAWLARDVLLGLHRDQLQGLDDLAPRPAGFKEDRICALSGARATDACERVFVEWFRPGSEPGEDCAMHLRLALDRRSGKLASAATMAADRELTAVALLPARYAAWARGQRMPTVERLAPERTAAAAPERVTRATLRVRSPEAGAVLAIDPDAPPAFSTLALAVDVDPPAREVVWWVDGAPWKIAAVPDALRWPLARGEHVFQARLVSGEASPPVRVRVE